MANRMQISSEQADQLLDRLSNDDDFRKQFAADHVQALKGMGIEIPKALAKMGPLPDQKTIAGTRAQLKEQMVGESASWVIFSGSQD